MKDLLDKIKNQSTILIVLLLVYTYFALKDTNSYTSPIALSGFVTLFLSIFLALTNYLYMQISEGYKSIISEFKGVINSLKSQEKFTREHYSGMLTESNQKKEVSKEYTAIEEEETKSN